MITMKKTILSNEKGFALVMAIIASMILLAVGMLVINMSTGDLISSSMTVGNKKAFAAVESGINRALQDFSIDSSTWIVGNTSYSDCANADLRWRTIDYGTDSATQFYICLPSFSSSMPPVPVPGSAIGEWGYLRFNTSVAGKNTSYNSLYQVDVGIGYGPAPIK
jgi:hypothetical protein